MVKRKKFEIQFQGAPAYKGFVNKKEGKVGEKDTRILWGEQKSDKHINTIITKEGKISTHATTQTPLINNENILPSTEAKELFNQIESELQKQMLGREYFGNDLILLRKDKLQEFVNFIKGDENQKQNKIDLTPLSQDEHKKQLQEYFAGPITRQELEKITDSQILITPDKKILLYFGKKVFDVTEFSNNPFNNTLGAMMGFSKIGIEFDKLQDKINENIRKIKEE